MPRRLGDDTLDVLGGYFGAVSDYEPPNQFDPGRQETPVPKPDWERHRENKFTPRAVDPNDPNDREEFERALREEQENPGSRFKDGDELPNDIRKAIEQELKDLEHGLQDDPNGEFKKKLLEAYEEWRAMTKEQYFDILRRYEKLFPPKPFQGY